VAIQGVEVSKERILTKLAHSAMTKCRWGWW
jgi:hypothetical protein